MSNKIEGVPEGWELVGIRRAKKGEFSVQGGTPETKQWEFDSVSVYPIVRKLPEPLKVEAGKYYRTKSGEVHGPMFRLWEQDAFHWVYKKGYGGLWSDSGKHNSLSGASDFVAEVPATVKVAAGKYYKQRDGVVIGPMVYLCGGGPWPWAIEGKRRGDQWSDSGKRCLEGCENTDLVEEVRAPQPTYRPFASAEEFKPFRDKWIQRKPEEDGTVHGAFQSTSYSDEGCYVGDDYTSYADLLPWKFEDGTPCGMKVS